MNTQMQEFGHKPVELAVVMCGDEEQETLDELTGDPDQPLDAPYDSHLDDDEDDDDYYSDDEDETILIDDEDILEDEDDYEDFEDEDDYEDEE